MTFTLKSLFAAAALGATLASATAQEINFGIIATDSASAQRERWEPFFRDMERRRPGSRSPASTLPTTPA
jgi:phosphonate transport system substrate-binding protein